MRVSLDQEEAEEGLSMRHDLLQALCSLPPAPLPSQLQSVLVITRNHTISKVTDSQHPPYFLYRPSQLPLPSALPASQSSLSSPDPLGHCVSLPSLLSTPRDQQESSSNLFLQKHESTLGETRARMPGSASWNILLTAV